MKSIKELEVSNYVENSVISNNLYDNLKDMCNMLNSFKVNKKYNNRYSFLEEEEFLQCYETIALFYYETMYNFIINLEEEEEEAGAQLLGFKINKISNNDKIYSVNDMIEELSIIDNDYCYYVYDRS